VSERITRDDEDEAEILRLFERFPDRAARDELVGRFLPLAEHLARRFAGRGEPLDDLVQVASLGLLRSIDRFDAERGVQFATYASVTIVGELKRHFRDKGWSLRVPRSLQESAMVVNRTLATLWQELSRSPTVAEVARRADLSEDQVLEAMEEQETVDEQLAGLQVRRSELDARGATLRAAVAEAQAQVDRELAAELAARDPHLLRMTRHVLTHRLKKVMLEELELGLAVEGLVAAAPRGS
jgi:RNA polymerase sigma factor (sigma-70 family)